MPKAKTEQSAVKEHEEELPLLPLEEEEPADVKKNGIGVNPYMQRLNRAMLEEPYPVELGRRGTMHSEDFVLAKLDQFIVRPLEIQTEDQWMMLARRLFPYRRRQEERAMEERANELLEQVQDNPDLLRRLVQRLSAQLVAHQGGLPVLDNGIYPRDYGQQQLTATQVATYS